MPVTNNLWREQGGAPRALRDIEYDAQGLAWTDLATNPLGQAACGLEPAPDYPDHDPATHRPEWNAVNEDWVLVEIEPVASLPDTPVAVDMRQACLKLHDEGRLAAVEAYVATQDERVQIEWARAKELRRDHPLVGIMGLSWGMTSDDMDQWFRDAAAIGPTLAV